MNTILAVAAPSVVGPVALVVLFLLLVAGLVLVVRLLTVRLDHSLRGCARSEDVLEAAGEGEAAGPARPASADERSPARPLTGRVLKERYLSGRITRAEYERELRRLQIEQSLREGQ